MADLIKEIFGLTLTALLIVDKFVDIKQKTKKPKTKKRKPSRKRK